MSTGPMRLVSHAAGSDSSPGKKEDDLREQRFRIMQAEGGA
jgi:hypothetical protein